MIWESVARSASLFVLSVLLILGPAAAATAASSAAVYGSTSGFIPESHSDMITVVYTIPGHSGGLFDQSVASFTDTSTEIIFIGNDADFSNKTASAIEQAVWNGKILVIGYPATGKFGDSLPVNSESPSSEASSTLVVTSLNNGVAREVFSGLNKTFTVNEPVAERLTGTVKPGSVSLMSFNNGDPALVYRQYGSGYVVEWMFAAPETYLGTDVADSITYGAVKSLLTSMKGSTTPVTTVATTAVPTTTLTTLPATQETTVTAKTGNAIIQSNPLGARVYVDGIYQGKTPFELDDLPTGYHSVRMTLDGYYNFDGSAYIVDGKTITVFGSLQEAPLTTATSQATTVVTPVITTAAPTTTPSSAGDALASPTVIAAGIGIITAGIGAYATIYTHKEKKE